MKVGQWLSAMEAAPPEQVAGTYGDALTRLQEAAPALLARGYQRRFLSTVSGRPRSRRPAGALFYTLDERYGALAQGCSPASPSRSRAGDEILSAAHAAHPTREGPWPYGDRSADAIRGQC
jgi:hypothetical protein